MNKHGVGSCSLEWETQFTLEHGICAQPLLVVALDEDSYEESCKHHQYPSQCLQREHVAIHDAGQNDAQCLSGGHDEGEHNGAICRDGVEDEQLAHSRADGDDASVRAENGVGEEEN